jgi:hypothetical protein
MKWYKNTTRNNTPAAGNEAVDEHRLLLISNDSNNLIRGVQSLLSWPTATRHQNFVMMGQDPRLLPLKLPSGPLDNNESSMVGRVHNRQWLWCRSLMCQSNAAILMLSPDITIACSQLQRWRHAVTKLISFSNDFEAETPIRAGGIATLVWIDQTSQSPNDYLNGIANTLLAVQHDDDRSLSLLQIQRILCGMHSWPSVLVSLVVDSLASSDLPVCMYVCMYMSAVFAWASTRVFLSHLTYCVVQMHILQQ